MSLRRCSVVVRLSALLEKSLTRSGWALPSLSVTNSASYIAPKKLYWPCEYSSGSYPFGALSAFTATVTVSLALWLLPPPPPLQAASEPSASAAVTATPVRVVNRFMSVLAPSPETEGSCGGRTAGSRHSARLEWQRCGGGHNGVRHNAAQWKTTVARASAAANG